MKFRKGLLLLALVLALSPRALAEDTAQDQQMLQRVRRSVVHLYAIGTNQDGQMTSRWTGTGFAVGIAGEDSDIFLTNWHVVTGSGNYSQEHVRIWLLKDDAQFENKIPLADWAVECQILATTEGFPDVAVIRTLEPVEGYAALPLLSSWQAGNGTQVYALGFPGLQATNQGADSGPEDVAISQGVITDHLIMQSAGSTWSLIHNAPIDHGYSGGPLVNAQGVVVGQNTYGFEDASQELFCALYTDYGMALLDQLGIAYTVASGPSRVGAVVANLLGMLDWWGYALVGAGFVLLLICRFPGRGRAAAKALREDAATPREDTE